MDAGIVQGAPPLAGQSPASLPDADAPSVRLLAKRGDQVVLAPKVKVGEPFHVVVTIAARPNVVVNIPASFDTNSFEVVERREIAPLQGGERSFDLTFVGWEPGTKELPAIPVTYVAEGQGVKQITAGKMTVEVLTEIEDQGKAELRPITGPVAVVQKDWRLVYGATAVVGGILISVLVIWWTRTVRFRRRIIREEQAAVDTRPPDEIALGKLRALRSSGLLDQVDRRPFYFSLTEIVREFLGKRFGFDALELTTSELLAALERAPGAEVARKDVEEWLLGCDLVKYASVKVSRDEGQAALDRAVVLVERLKPVVVPMPAAPAEGEGRANA
jgi:hypothetical protein